MELRDIPGFPGYQITRGGQVWSKERKDSFGCSRGGSWLRAWSCNHGYLKVDLGGKYRYVHRLVLETFVGPCPEGMECRHLNGNPADNRAKNLKWGTRSENHQDKLRHGTCSWAKLTEEEVRWIDYQCRAGVPYKDIAWAYNTSESNVSRIAQHKRWQHLWT